MNSSHGIWIYGFHSFAHACLLTALLVVLWIGWLRQRAAGYLVLIAWALLALFSIGGQLLGLPPFEGGFKTILPKAWTIIANIPPHFVVSLVSAVLLFVGLAMLVFQKSRSHTTGLRH